MLWRCGIASSLVPWLYMRDGQEAVAKTYRMLSRHYHWLFKAIPQHRGTYRTQLGLVSVAVTTVCCYHSIRRVVHHVNFCVSTTLCQRCGLSTLMSVMCQNIVILQYKRAALLWLVDIIYRPALTWKFQLHVPCHAYYACTCTYNVHGHVTHM